MDQIETARITSCGTGAKGEHLLKPEVLEIEDGKGECDRERSNSHRRRGMESPVGDERAHHGQASVDQPLAAEGVTPLVPCPEKRHPEGDGHDQRPGNGLGGDGESHPSTGKNVVPKATGAEDPDEAEERQELEKGLQDIDPRRVHGKTLGDGERE